MRLERAAPRRSVPALTALVDIVFILLFFFMLAARTAPPQGLALRVEAPSPPAAGAAEVPEAIVRSGGRVGYGGREVDADALAGELGGAQAAELRLRADRDARLQDLVIVLDALRRAGIAVQLLPGVP